MSAALHAVVMPKWGLAMQEGAVADWLVDEGAAIEPGQEICDIETSKIAGPMEATRGGTLVRRVAKPGATLPVGSLIAVVADAGSSPDAAAVDAFVDAFQAEFAAAQEEAQDSAPAAQKIDVGGRAISYLKIGDGGVPAVFVHGFGGDLNSWLFNQEALSERRATYALELPGHGASDKRVTDGSLAALAGVVGGFLDALGIERAHLVGHSLGGAVVARLALERADAVASLSLIASAGLGAEIDGGYIDGFIAGNSRRELKPVLTRLFADPGLVSRDMINELLKYKRLDGVDAALKTIAAACFGGGRQHGSLQLRDALGGLTMPALAIFGRDDAIIPSAHADGLPATLTVHVLDGAGHMPHMERAAEVNRLLADQFG